MSGNIWAGRIIDRRRHASPDRSTKSIGHSSRLLLCPPRLRCLLGDRFATRCGEGLRTPSAADFSPHARKFHSLVVGTVLHGNSATLSPSEFAECDSVRVFRRHINSLTNTVGRSIKIYLTLSLLSSIMTEYNSREAFKAPGEEAMPLQKIKFQTNIMVEAALKFTEGRLCDSQFGDPQY